MQKKTRRTAAVAFLVAACALVSGCSTLSQDSDVEPVSATSFMLDTVITITLYDGQSQDTLDGALDVCSKYENMLSRTVRGSDIWNINHANGDPTVVDSDTADLINTAIKYSKLSCGSFDISIGAVSGLWNFKGDDPQVPDAGRIAEAVTHVDYRKIKVVGNTVTLEDPDMRLDLSGIAKGYIADRIVDYLTSKGVTNAIVNLGGNVVAMGSKGGSGWTIGLQDPEKQRNSPIAAVRIKNKSVVTSGIYERCFTASDGTFYHHELDPKTGYPTQNSLASVTIISDKSVDGDALSTCCFVLGLERGMKLVESLDGIEAVFIDTEENTYLSSGIGGENGIPYVTTDEASATKSSPEATPESSPVN